MALFLPRLLLRRVILLAPLSPTAVPLLLAAALLTSARLSVSAAVPVTAFALFRFVTGGFFCAVLFQLQFTNTCEIARSPARLVAGCIGPLTEESVRTLAKCSQVLAHIASLCELR